MITSAEISKELGVQEYRVRYALDKLRKEGAVDFRKVGGTFVYDNDAVALVRNEVEE